MSVHLYVSLHVLSVCLCASDLDQEVAVPSGASAR